MGVRCGMSYEENYGEKLIPVTFVGGPRNGESGYFPYRHTLQVAVAKPTEISGVYWLNTGAGNAAWDTPMSYDTFTYFLRYHRITDPLTGAVDCRYTYEPTPSYEGFGPTGKTWDKTWERLAGEFLTPKPTPAKPSTLSEKREYYGYTPVTPLPLP